MGLTFIFLGCESFVLLDLLSGTRSYILAATLGLGWKDLLVKEVAMICLHFMNSTIFFCNDGKGQTSVPQGLHLMTCVLLSFL